MSTWQSWIDTEHELRCIGAHFPGEKPWGNMTTRIEGHDILAVRANSNLSTKNLVIPPGAKPLGVPEAIMAFYDLQCGEDAGIWAMFNDTDTAKGSLITLTSRVANAPRANLDIPVDRNRGWLAAFALVSAVEPALRAGQR